MINALFFIGGAIFGAGVMFMAHRAHTNLPEISVPFLPQRVKPPAYVPHWNEPVKEEGTVVMPQRADIKNNDLKIDDLLQ